MAPKAKELRDELARYLSTDPEQVTDVLVWWTERKATYPHLSRMALDYLSIPGTSSNLLCCTNYLIQLLTLQQPLLTWSVYLVEADYSFHTFETASPRSRSER